MTDAIRIPATIGRQGPVVKKTDAARLTLAGFEAPVGLVDHENPTPAANQAIAAMTTAKRAE